MRRMQATPEDIFPTENRVLPRQTCGPRWLRTSNRKRNHKNPCPLQMRSQNGLRKQVHNKTRMETDTIRWNEQSFWPDPWELLTNLGYCDLARALGIAYTLMTVKKQNFTSLEIIETNQDNLVLVDSGKYILNWAPGTLLNIHSNPIEISRRINCSKLQSFLK